MPDTVRTKAALLALYADNTVGDISAQDLRDFVVTALTPPGATGNIIFNNGSSFDATSVLSTDGSGLTVFQPNTSGVGSQPTLKFKRSTATTSAVYGEAFDGSTIRFATAPAGNANAYADVAEVDGKGYWTFGGISTTNLQSRVMVVGSESTAHGLGACLGIRNTASGGSWWSLRAGATGNFTGAGSFSIADANGYRFVIDATGNIGISTHVPAYRLDVNGRTRARGFIPTIIETSIGSGSYAADTSTASLFLIYVQDDLVLENPINGADGQTITYRLTQDEVGYRSITVGSSFLLPPDLSLNDLSGSPNSVSRMSATYVAGDDAWEITGIRKIKNG